MRASAPFYSPPPPLILLKYPLYPVPFAHDLHTDAGMATIKKQNNGTWRAWVTVAGKRKTKVRPTKAQAMAWVVDQERKRDAGFTWFQALDKYQSENTPQKRPTTQRWELLRFPKLKEQIPDRPLVDVTPTVLAEWRDARLKSVGAGTVLRELSLIGSVFSVAVKEWRWCHESPVAQIKKPSAPPPRDRLLTDEEIEKMPLALGYVEGPPEGVQQRVAVAFLLALETGMRCGEICGIRPEDRRGRVVHLPETKNGTARDVPLSSEAARLLDLVGNDFELTSRQVDANFRKARDRAGMSGFTFHDSRHWACTRLARKLSHVELARMMGHKDLKMVMRYYNETAEEIARRLD